MIRIRLTSLMEDYAFKVGRRVEWQEVAQATDIHRSTLSKMVSSMGYNATLSNIDKLCRFFDCTVGEMLEYVPDEEVPTGLRTSFKGPKANTEAAAAGARARHKKTGS